MSRNPTRHTPRASHTGVRSARRRLSEEIADQITSHLVAERLRPGDRLPTEPELVDLYDVSRTVVREASRLLVERGLVDIRPGRGMVVAPFDGASITRQWKLMLAREQGSFEQLMELRLALEVAVAGFAAERRSDAELERIRAALEQFSSPDTSHQAAIDADLEFHTAVADAAHNPFFGHVVSPVNDHLRLAYRPSRGYDTARDKTIAEHRAIAAAIEAKDVEGARNAAHAHLDRIQHDITTLVYDRDEPDVAPLSEGE